VECVGKQHRHDDGGASLPPDPRKYVADERARLFEEGRVHVKPWAKPTDSPRKSVSDRGGTRIGTAMSREDECLRANRQEIRHGAHDACSPHSVFD
jgi:hypothetical protein